MSGRGAWSIAAGVVALAAVVGTLLGGTTAGTPVTQVAPAQVPARPPPAAEPETPPPPGEGPRAWGHFVAPASWARASAGLSTGCAPRVEFQPVVNPENGRFALVVTTLDRRGRPVVRRVQPRWRAGETTGTLAQVPVGDRRDRPGTRYLVAVFVVPEATREAGYRRRPPGWVLASKALTLTRTAGYVPCR